ncbi:hypothetical protein [Psychroserpens ponticola]|uniref:Peptidase S74 domain-containing protein n=1 Tax=Psychroserpens ponticola TaxID=2932268 RepID=A0ABY7RZS6_9FLAO|nr:hypothetical protein [Psychroserpens ponticola]WCO02634.1 hypothetical protein MUN68_003855 [Psychroserpens ponticola]
MKKLLLFIPTFFICTLAFSQIFPTNTSNPIASIDMNSGPNRFIEWPTSPWGNGFGHRIVSGDPGGMTLLNFESRHNSTTWNTSMSITSNGVVGIGTVDFAQNNSDSRLLVEGKILCEEIEVVQNVFPDYVFQKYYTGVSELKSDYNMLTLEEIEVYTKANHHLPEIPSAEEVKENGMQLKDMTTILLQKVEELTLYTIEQEKRIKALEAELKN